MRKSKEEEKLPKKSMKELTKNYKQKKKTNPKHLEDFEELLTKAISKRNSC